ncbi:AMP-binding protein [Nocardia sp. NPDC088792]|uniref:AMP-binding protein n=1 Tax=Nocardia sp. NPDC088792 TaxID=3364332 RepID=UPI003827EBCB
MTTALPSTAHTLGDLLEHWGRERPDSLAIEYGDLKWTWAQWRARVRQLTGALQATGIGPGDTVAVVDKNHPACLEVSFAAGNLGAANAVINWRLAGDELDYVLNDCGPKVLVVGAELPRNPSGKILKRQLRQPYWENRDRQI